MNIKFYGTRGSIAVASKESKKYGGNTTCLYIKSNSGDIIIVDAGTGIRELGVHLLQCKDKINLIFTHYHWDHIQGFPFFAPIYFKNSVIDVYGPSKEETARKALTYQMNKPYFPARLSDLPAQITFKELRTKMEIGNLEIKTIATNHPNYTVGLKFIEGKNSCTFLTDNELFAKNGNTPYTKFVDFVKGVKFIIHDAQYTDKIYENKKGWGHSTPNQVLKLSRDAGIKNIILTHHDPPSTDEFIDNILRDIRDKYSNIIIQAAADGKTIILK